MVPQSYYRCWVEIDLDALRHNVAAIHRRVGPRVKLMAVVKADAYGHGLAQVGGVLMQCGVDAFAVANLSEALALRQIGGSGWPILLFGSALPFEIPKMIEQNITPTISTVQEARLFEKEAARCGKTVDVQIEIDTGHGACRLLARGCVEGHSENRQVSASADSGFLHTFPRCGREPERDEERTGIVPQSCQPSPQVVGVHCCMAAPSTRCQQRRGAESSRSRSRNGAAGVAPVRNHSQPSARFKAPTLRRISPGARVQSARGVRQAGSEGTNDQLWADVYGSEVDEDSHGDGRLCGWIQPASLEQSAGAHLWRRVARSLGA